MSAFVPGFENDIFISYSHDDDEVWIQAFEEALCGLLKGKNSEISVWRDVKRLRVGAHVPTEIETALVKSALFMAVLSPNYRKSDWCETERLAFIRPFASQDECEKSGRFVTIVMLPWADDGHRQFLGSINQIDFFHERSTVSLKSVEFKRQMNKLADQLADKLEELRSQLPRVYVAWPAKDCRSIRIQIHAELHDRGYDVQPDGARDSAYGDPLILNELKRSVLTAFLIGAIPEPSLERLVRLAADHDHRLAFWVAPAAQGCLDANQNRLIEALRQGYRPDLPQARLRSDYIFREGLALELFIHEVLNLLQPKESEAVPPLAMGGAPRVYIVHDTTTKNDAEIATEIKDEISKKEGMEVFLPSGDLRDHRTLLKTCDGLLLYSEGAPQDWLIRMAPEVILAEQRAERVAPVKSRAFLVPDPDAWSSLTGLRSTLPDLPGLRDLKVIPSSSHGKPNYLEPFLAPLRVEGTVANER